MLVRLSLTAVGVLQGLALWLLRERWPVAQPGLAAAVAWLVFVIASALVIHFAWTGRDTGRLLALATVTGLVFAAVGGWVGLQLPAAGAPAFGDDTRVRWWAVAAPAALYTLGPFLQVFQATGTRRFPYPRLYLHAWNNFFIGVLGAIFTVALWIVLKLWGELFALLGIHWFAQLFGRHFVQHVTTGAALGYGLALGRESQQVIASLRGLTQLLLRVLLPLLAAVTLAFLATIAATGLTELYATRKASFILLSWVAGYLVIFNAVYQDGAGERPYPMAVRRVVEAAALAMPVMAALGIHALWLRIDQYGLTPERMWGMVGGVVLGLYALGYATAVPFQGARWMPGVARVNVTLALVVVATALAMHTPLLDPLAWSAASQARRLTRGEVSATDFDYGFLRFHLGRSGDAVLERLRDTGSGSDAELVRDRVAAVLATKKESAWDTRLSTSAQGERFERHPAGAPWPAGLLAAIEHQDNWLIDRCGAVVNCLVFDADVDADGVPEAVLVARDHSHHEDDAAVFRRKGEDWHLLGWLTPAQRGASTWDADLLAAVRAGRVVVESPRQQDLVFDGLRFRLIEGAR